jgi:ribosomal protein S18 acetylase RimI-like enzyme
MTGVPVEVRPTIDRDWLESAAAKDPIAHAFALWDLDHNPGRIRFFSVFRGEATVGYLLVWLGHPTAPIAHWFGTSPEAHRLAAVLPERPSVAIVPPPVVQRVEEARGVGREYDIRVLARQRGEPPPSVAHEGNIRPLVRADVPMLGDWARRQSDPVAAEYPYLDPEVELTWGAFDGERIVGVVRAEVRLPQIWILGGVYVHEAHRGRGWGRELVGAALRAASAAGASTALYVRADRDAARALYGGLGFREVGRRVWVDLGAGLAP